MQICAMLTFDEVHLSTNHETKRNGRVKDGSGAATKSVDDEGSQEKDDQSANGWPKLQEGEGHDPENEDNGADKFSQDGSEQLPVIGLIDIFFTESF